MNNRKAKELRRIARAHAQSPEHYRVLYKRLKRYYKNGTYRI